MGSKGTQKVLYKEMEFPVFEWIRRTAYFLHSGDYYMEKH